MNSRRKGKPGHGLQARQDDERKTARATGGSQVWHLERLAVERKRVLAAGDHPGNGREHLDHDELLLLLLLLLLATKGFITVVPRSWAALTRGTSSQHVANSMDKEPAWMQA